LLQFNQIINLYLISLLLKLYSKILLLNEYVFSTVKLNCIINLCTIFLKYDNTIIFFLIIIIIFVIKKLQMLFYLYLEKLLPSLDHATLCFIRFRIHNTINVHYFNLFKHLKKYLLSLSFNDIIVK